VGNARAVSHGHCRSFMNAVVKVLALAWDEQQRCCGGRRDHCICPAERKTARRHDPPVSLAQAEQQRCPRRPGACTDADPAPSASALGLTGSAPAVREASADHLDAAPRRSPRGIVRSAATGRALCHGSDSQVDCVVATVGDHRTVCSPQPAAADRRPPPRGARFPERTQRGLAAWLRRIRRRVD
jgi:hypothetical protein